MRPQTLADLAAVAGVAVPVIEGFGNFGVFAGTYVAACEVLRGPDDLSRLMTEVVEDAAADGAVWVEPQLWPAEHRDRIGPDELVMEIAVDAARVAAARTGIGVGLVVSADRTGDPAEAVAHARLAARWAGRGVVGFGLANYEVGYPPEPFTEAFAIARDAGLLSLPHAGELAGADSVRGALEALRADRIQHGIRVLDDPALLAAVVEAGTCLDVCPTSNVMLSVVPSMAEHPLPTLLRAGVRCSLGADDSLLFGSGLVDEYTIARKELGLGDDELAAVARASIAASGAPDDLRLRADRQITAWLAAPSAPLAASG